MRTVIEMQGVVRDDQAGCLSLEGERPAAGRNALAQRVSYLRGRLVGIEGPRGGMHELTSSDGRAKILGKSFDASPRA